ETVGLFTSDEEDPPTIARQLLARGLDYFKAYVCENIGAPDERVTQGELSEIQEMEFASLNVMILKRKPGRPDQQRVAGRFRRFGKDVARLLEAASAALRPGGRIVVHVASLDNLSAVYATLKSLAPHVSALLVNLARGNEQLETLRFEALNPTFLLGVMKGE